MKHLLVLTAICTPLLLTALTRADEPTKPSKPSAERVKIVREMYQKLPCDILGFAEPAKKMAAWATTNGSMTLVLQDTKDRKISISFHDGSVFYMANPTKISDLGDRLPLRGPEESAVYGLLLRVAANPPEKAAKEDVESVKEGLTLLDERYAGAMPITGKGPNK